VQGGHTTSHPSKAEFSLVQNLANMKKYIKYIKKEYSIKIFSFPELAK
jgi:hypothetical protein